MEADIYNVINSETKMYIHSLMHNETNINIIQYYIDKQYINHQDSTFITVNSHLLHRLFV